MLRQGTTLSPLRYPPQLFILRQRSMLRCFQPRGKCPSLLTLVSIHAILGEANSIHTRWNPGTTFSGVVSCNEGCARISCSIFIATRHMHHLELSLGRYSRFCIGLDLLKLSAKYQPACYTMRMVKFWLGDWKRRMLAPCLVLRDVNGEDSFM